VGPVDVGAQHGAVAHRGGHIGLLGDGARAASGTGRERSEHAGGMRTASAHSDHTGRSYSAEPDGDGTHVITLVRVLMTRPCRGGTTPPASQMLRALRTRRAVRQLLLTDDE